MDILISREILATIERELFEFLEQYIPLILITLYYLLQAELNLKQREMYTMYNVYNVHCCTLYIYTLTT